VGAFDGGEGIGEELDRDDREEQWRAPSGRWGGGRPRVQGGEGIDSPTTQTSPPTSATAAATAPVRRLASPWGLTTTARVAGVHGDDRAVEELLGLEGVDGGGGQPRGLDDELEGGDLARAAAEGVDLLAAARSATGADRSPGGR
jgi:hypothetical protein